MVANESRNAEIARLRQKGHKPTAIAKTLGLSPGIVSGVLFRAGMTSEARGRGHGLTEIEKVAMRADRARGWSYARIGRAHGVHLMTAFRYTREVRG